MPGLSPMFSIGSVAARINHFADKRKKNAYLALAYLGEEIVNKAKDNPPPESGGTSFHDRTGNLRSSIGWAILEDGFVKQKKLKVVGKGAEGKEAADALLIELATEHNEGLVLVVVAGMEYAAAVEALGFDVITGSIPTKAETRKRIEELL